jgi:AraC-like DNA-binding protein
MSETGKEVFAMELIAGEEQGAVVETVATEDSGARARTLLELEEPGAAAASDRMPPAASVGVSLDVLDLGRGEDSRIELDDIGPALLLQVASNRSVWLRQPPGDVWALVYQVDGMASYMGQRGRRCRLEAGDLCVVDMQHPFQMEPTGAYLQWVVFVRQTGRMRGVSQLPRRTMHVPARDAPAVAWVKSALHTLVRQRHGAAEGHQAALQNLVRAVGAVPLPGVPLAGHLDRALRFIEAHHDGSSLEAGSIAAALGLSRRRLDQVFTGLLGEPAASFLKARCLQQAAEALADPAQAHRPIRDIALDCGYPHAAPFTRAFARRFGCTPSRYRELEMGVKLLPAQRGSEGLPAGYLPR